MTRKVLVGITVGIAATGSWACSDNEVENCVLGVCVCSGCEAIYRREDGEQDLVWHSDHFPDICAGKAAAFVDRLQAMGVQCAPR